MGSTKNKSEDIISKIRSLDNLQDRIDEQTQKEAQRRDELLGELKAELGDHTHETAKEFASMEDEVAFFLQDPAPSVPAQLDAVHGLPGEHGENGTLGSLG